MELLQFEICKNFVYFQIPLILCVTFITKYSFSHQERSTNEDMSADYKNKKYR